MKDIEHQEQVRFVTWLEANYPEHRVFAIPNGGKRGKVQAIKLRQEGVRPGVPDLFVPSLKLFIEMKKPEGGRVSKEQKDWLKYLTDNNYNAVIANGFEQAKFLFLGVLP